MLPVAGLVVSHEGRKQLVVLSMLGDLVQVRIVQAGIPDCMEELAHEVIALRGSLTVSGLALLVGGVGPGGSWHAGSP